jgi:hypothetical protein
VFPVILSPVIFHNGVLSALAVSNQILLIAIGLGIGALFIRSLTIYLVRKGTLSEYKYLENGAFWAIGSLAILLLSTTIIDIPELVTGLMGVLLIGASFVHSMLEKRKLVHE